MRAWALVQNGKELERHSTRHACVVAAYERGLVLRASVDRPYDCPGKFMIEGVEITELTNQPEEDRQ